MDASENNEQAKLVTRQEQFELIKLEMEQALNTFRAQFTLFLQALTILIVADVTVIGYAITNQIAGVLLLGVIFPLGGLYLIYKTRKLILPSIYIVISLEHKHGRGNTDWLGATFASYTDSPQYVQQLRTISMVRDPEERMDRLRSMPLPVLTGGKGLTRGTLILVAIGQVFAAAFLVWFYNWRLF